MQANNDQNDKADDFLFLLMPGFSMVAFTTAIEPLRAANEQSGKVLHRWQTATIDGNAVEAGNGIDSVPDCAADAVYDCHAVFICSGENVYDLDLREWQATITRFVDSNTSIGALCTGAYVLARCGLLHGYRAAINWDSKASLGEEFPTVVVSNELFEIDRDRYTCSGGAAPIDMMLALIEATHGEAFSGQVSDRLTQRQVRGCSECQRMPLQQQLIAQHPLLAEASSLMEANIEEPLALEEIAQYVGVSRRHLERLFQNHLRCVPNRYYMELRLQRARQLILQTGKSLLEVACACGFTTAPHFSKCYRDLYGIPPSHERRPRNDQRPARMQIVRATGT